MQLELRLKAGMQTIREDLVHKMLMTQLAIASNLSEDGSHAAREWVRQMNGIKRKPADSSFALMKAGIPVKDHTSK